MRRLHQWLLALAVPAPLVLPAVAFCQEPQPWTNTYGYGDRVVPAMPVAPVAGSIRAGGSAGSTNIEYTQRDGTKIDDGVASFLSGRTGMSWGLGPADIFVTTHFYQVDFAKAPSSTAPIVSGPYTSLGDAAIGARYTRSLSDSMRVGAEAGAVVFGATGSSGETDATFVGPETGATSPFARGLFTWKGVGEGEESKLVTSVNLGFYSDNSWEMWEAAFKEAKRNPEDADRPMEQERAAMGFYGETGTATRILFGASAAFAVTSRIRPYLEITGELTGPDTTMRATPGIAVVLMERMDLLVSGDLDLSGDGLKASPRAPAARANAGFRYAFGAQRARAGIPSGGGAATRWISLFVNDEAGKPIAGATVTVLEGDRPTSATATTDERGEAKLRERDLRGNRKLLVEKEPFSPRTVALGDRGGRDSLPPLRLSMPARVAITLWDTQKNQPFREKTVVNVWAMPATSADRPKKLASRETFTGDAKMELPLASGTSTTIAIQVIIDGLGSKDFKFENVRAGSLVELGTTAAGDRRIFVNLDRKCMALGEACSGGADSATTATPAPTATPATPALPPERFTVMVFEPDLADVKSDEGKLLLEKTRGRAAIVYVNAKNSGDVSFAKAVIGARVAALKQFFSANGLAGVRVEIGEADTDNVIVELK